MRGGAGIPISRLHVKRRIIPRLRDLNRAFGTLRVFFGSRNGGIAFHRDINRVVQRLRQFGGGDFGFENFFRQLPDYFLIYGVSDFQIAFGGDSPRNGGGVTGVRLRHVRFRQFTDAETVARIFQLAFQNGFVVLVQFNDRHIANHPRIGGDGIGQRGLFDTVQIRDFGFEPRFGGFDRSGGLKSGKQGLNRVHAERHGFAFLFGEQGGRSGTRVLIAVRNVARHGWLISRFALRDFFIDRGNILPLRQNRRIGDIGVFQSLLQCFGTGGKSQQNGGQRHTGQDLFQFPLTRHNNPPCKHWVIFRPFFLTSITGE